MAIIGLNNVCTPAQIYMTVSFFLIFVMLLYTYYGKINISCLGKLSCDTTNHFQFIIQIMSVLFWTWALNIICKSYGESVSWSILLIPTAFFTIMLSMNTIFP